MSAVTETRLSRARLSRRGKVREIFDLGESLLLVASDRISAYDCVLSPGIPDKGKILNQLSNFWFEKFADVANHIVEKDVSRFPEDLAPDAALLEGRAVIVRKAEVIPFECVARGYLAGSGWANTASRGGLRRAATHGLRRPIAPRPIFTPAIKNAPRHDENVSFERMADDIVRDCPAAARPDAFLYERAAAHALEKGLILADTNVVRWLGEGIL